MDISGLLTNSQLSRGQFSQLEETVNTFNKSIDNSRKSKNVLDKQDFLKILITQLTHQDPTQPLEDKEFIAQMAQFSSLEQMMNINNDVTKMQQLMAKNQAYELLGKTVSVMDGDALVEGKVEEISGQDFPQLFVQGKYYDYSKVEKVKVE